MECLTQLLTLSGVQLMEWERHFPHQEEERMEHQLDLKDKVKGKEEQVA